MTQPACPRTLRAALLAGTAVIAGTLGCGGGDGPPRYAVSGHVTFQGQPVPQGFIVFEPDAERGNHGPGAGAVIEKGRYVADPGTVGGTHCVRISGSDGIPIEVPGEGLNPRGRPLFDDYITSAELPSADTTWNVEVELPQP